MKYRLIISNNTIQTPYITLWIQPKSLPWLSNKSKTVYTQTETESHKTYKYQNFNRNQRTPSFHYSLKTIKLDHPQKNTENLYSIKPD